MHSVQRQNAKLSFWSEANHLVISALCLRAEGEAELQGEANTRLASLREQSYALAIFFLVSLSFSLANGLIVSSCFAVHYTPGPLNSLFRIARGLDGNVSLQFQGQGSLFSERSAPGRDALIHAGDQRTMRSILTTAPLEDCDRKIYRKPGFKFGDAAPDIDHQLLAGKGSGSSIWMARSITSRLVSVISRCLSFNA